MARIVALGGAIPALIGGVGAFSCAGIARNTSRAANQRIVLCLGVTVLSWLVFVAFLVLWGVVGAAIAVRRFRWEPVQG